MALLDQTLKLMIQLAPDPFVHLAFPDAVVGAPLPTDMAMEPQLVLDHLLRGQLGSDDCLFLIEAQSSFDKTDLERFCSYANRAEDRYHLPAFLIILWFLRDRRPPDPPFARVAHGIASMQRNYLNIDVYRLSAHDILNTESTTLLPLIPLMHGADIGVDNTVMQRIAETPDVELRQTLALLATVLIARERGNDWAETLLRRWIMDTTLIEESPLYQKWFADAEARGQAKGLAEGQAKGLAEGQAKGLAEGQAKGLAKGQAIGEVEGLSEALQLILVARFGPLEATLIDAIHQAAPATLRDMLAHAASETLDQLTNRLKMSA